MDLERGRRMAKTPYSDVGSEDILSAHLSGLQHDINKIQEVLNMKTAEARNFELKPVTDQDDPSLRFRIYEGDLRNWLLDPLPVIYRNGVRVNESQYELKAPYGAIVFKTQQKASDRITADFTYVIGESDVIGNVAEIPIGRENLVVNGDFSAGFEGWRTFNNTPEELFTFDNGYLRVTQDGSKISEWGQAFTDRAMDMYVAQVRAKGKGRFRVRWGDTSNSEWVELTDDFRWYTLYVDGTSGNRNLIFGFEGEYGDFDKVKLEVGEKPTYHTIGHAIQVLDQRVTDLEEEPSGGGGTLEIDGLYPYYPVSGSYFSHFVRDYHPIKSGANEYNPDSHIPAWNILVYGNTVDAFPLPVERKMRFSRAGIMVADGSGSSCKCRIGIYKDSGNMRPDKLLMQSGEITATKGNWGYADIDWELEAGFYWIAVHHGNTANYNGLDERSVLQVVRFNAESFLRNLAERPNPHTAYGGYRATGVTYGSSMPSTFPAGGELFKRTAYISPWLVIA